MYLPGLAGEFKFQELQNNIGNYVLVAILFGKSWLYVKYIYVTIYHGSTGCRVFKWGIQN